MKQLLIGAMVLAALVLAGCDPKELAVRDARELRSASLSVDQDDATWAAGESRVFTVGFEPADALVRDIQLVPNVAALVEIEPGERPGVFHVRARRAGQLKLTARVFDTGGVVESDVKVFTITGEYQPKMAFRLRGEGDAPEGKVFPKVMVCKSGQEFQVAAFSDNAHVQFEVSVSDPQTLDVVQTGPYAWVLRALEPGGVSVKFTMTDAFGAKREKRYRVYVYGSVAFETRVDLLGQMLQLDVVDYGYEPCGTRLAVDGTLYGWPEGFPKKRRAVLLNSLMDYIVLEDGAFFSDLVDEKGPFAELESLAPVGGKPYEARGMEVRFCFELDNPYIRVERVRAEQQSERNFILAASFVQNGLEENVPEEDDEADALEPEDAAVGGFAKVLKEGLPL